MNRSRDTFLAARDLRRRSARADAADLLLGARAGGFEESGERPGRTDDRLQQMERLRPPRLVAVEPPAHLRALLAIHGDEREALGRPLFLDMEERLAVDGRQEHGEELCRFEMPKDADRRIANGKILPDPEDGDRPRPSRNRLDLPGAGELRLGGGQAVVAFAETGQVGGGEGVVEGRDLRPATMSGACALGKLGSGGKRGRKPTLGNRSLVTQQGSNPAR